eukprot:scaffold1189_cov194-Amphora_coffeaeformis.AAC.18
MISKSLGTPLLLLLSLVLLAFDPAGAWAIPKSIRVDRNGTPRLANWVGHTVGWTTRALLLVRSAEELQVQIQASSNRQVLRGELDSLQLDARNLRGPLLHLKEFQLRASSISLGKWPLALLSLPLVAWKLRRAFIWILLISWISPAFGETIRAKAQPLREKLKGKPWSLDYKIVMAQTDVPASKLLQLALRAVLRSLMLNSVLGTAAAAGDTLTQLQNEANDLAEQQQSQSNPTATLRLGPSKNTTPQKQEAALDKNNPVKREPMLTKLLEATDFALTNTTFGKQGRLLLNADAILEDSQFSYTLRITPQPMVFEGRHRLVFASPECRFQTGVLIGGPLEKLLPDLWLPVGPGVGLPLGTNHWIREIDMKEGDTCTLLGSISFFRNEKPTGFGALVGDSFPRPLPFSTRNRALPPSRQ